MCQDLLFFVFFDLFFFQDVNLSDLSFSDSLPILSRVLLVSIMVVVCFSESEKTVLLCFFFKVAQVLHENIEAAMKVGALHCSISSPACRICFSGYNSWLILIFALAVC